MNTDQFIKIISTAQNRSLKKEFAWAAKNKDLLIPHLLKILKESISTKKELSYKDTGLSMATFLLAQFREKRAFPLIIALLKKMKGSLYENILNNELEFIPNILASTFNGKLKPLYDLIEDKKAYEFSRVAALETLTALFDTEQVKRKILITYFEKLLDRHIKHNDDHDFSRWIAEEALKIYPIEIIQKIRLSYYFLGEYAYYDDRGYSAISPSEFEKSMKKGKAYVLKKYLKSKKYHFIKSIHSEIGDWCCFLPEPEYMKKNTSKKEVVKPVETSKTQLLAHDDSEDEEEYFFVGDEKHMKQCHKLFGNFNEKGLLSLQDNYDTSVIDRAKDKLENLERDISRLCLYLNLMTNAAREMIDGDTPWQNDYDIEEHGDIGDFANDLYEMAESIEFNILEVLSEVLAPLCRLMPIDDIDFGEPTEFYKVPEDTLDEPDKKRSHLLFETD